MALVLQLFPGASILQAQSGTIPVKILAPAQGAIMEEGEVTLEWAPEGQADADASHAIVYQLQQAENSAFDAPVLRYEGPDRASVLTGFAEGERWFRVRAAERGEPYGPWSEPMQVQFHYIGMGKVWALMGTGLLVFILTLGAILRGHRRAVDEERATAATSA